MNTICRNPKYKAFNQEKTLREWSKSPECKVSLEILQDRVYRKWDLEKALTENKNEYLYEYLGEKKKLREWMKYMKLI